MIFLAIFKTIKQAEEFISVEYGCECQGKCLFGGVQSGVGTPRPNDCIYLMWFTLHCPKRARGQHLSLPDFMKNIYLWCHLFDFPLPLSGQRSEHQPTRSIRRKVEAKPENPKAQNCRNQPPAHANSKEIFENLNSGVGAIVVAVAGRYNIQIDYLQCTFPHLVGQWDEAVCLLHPSGRSTRCHTATYTP